MTIVSMRCGRVCFWAAIALLACHANFCEASTLRDPFICGKIECIVSTKFMYNRFITYHYKYDVTINTLFNGTGEGASTMNIETEFQLEFLTPCEGVLKIKQAKVKDQDENYMQQREKDFETKVSSHNLRFAFHNGMITEICPQEEEEDWVLNFKRGMLSLFQNPMTRFDIDFAGIEQDIHGMCNTKYHMIGQENTNLIIMKSKNLTECTDRYKYLSMLQTVRYNFQNKFQEWSVLQSENVCRITVNHNIYTAVSCREEHLFEPFSGKNSGPATIIDQKLIMVEEVNKTTDDIMEEKSEELEHIKHRYNLIHNHIPSTKEIFGELRAARDVLMEICRVEDARTKADTIDKNEDDETANGILVGLWGKLVRTSRGLHHTALNQLFSKPSSICTFGRKYILDALPYIGSVGSVQMIKNLTMKEGVYDNFRQEWLLSTAMIPRPHKDMIESMGEMLEANPSDKIVSLTTSSMIHSYCRNSKKKLEECCQEKQNMDIIKIFETNIKNILVNNPNNLSRTDRENVVISIKSLGNIGGFNREFQNYLMNIIEDKQINLPIRIHTVDAFRRVQCSEVRGYFLELFRKQSLNVEIRLASYLQVMRCPKYTTILEIINTLKHEKVKQVASFVWSHLENLEKSSIPSRVEKQGLLTNNAIPKFRRKPDIRKFSSNYEHGVFFDQYNAGGNYELNIITSPESYIPRSATLNLTIDMFGESINILEIKMRAEGFETYVESMFGENGPFGRSNIDEKLSKLRFSRSINEVNEIINKIDNLNYKNDAFLHRSPIMEFSIKVFGNEISYWNAEGNNEIMNTLTEMNPLYHIQKIIAGQENISYKKATMFLDTTYSVPTGCGLPINMNIMGNSIANLKMSGSMMGVNNFTRTKKFEFEGKMHPSMAVSVAATMSVNGGGLIATGIRVNTQLHTATALSANFHLESEKLASLKLSLPHTKQEIFEARSEMIVLHGKKEIKQQGLTKNKIAASTCSWSVLDKAMGLKLCATYEFPNMTAAGDSPYFILSGPAWYLLSLEKVDPSAKVYSFLYTRNRNETGQQIGFYFDTPGSKAKRIFNSTIFASKTDMKAIMNFQSAENHLTALVTYKNHEEIKLLECKLNIDGNRHFDTVMSLTKQEQKNGYILTPQIYIAVNDERITELAGTLRLMQKKGVSQCDVSLEFQTKKLASRLIGYINWNGPSKGSNLRLDYQFLGEKMETIRAKTLVIDREIGFKKDFYGELELNFTSYPQLNFFTILKYVGNQNHIDLHYNLSKTRESEDPILQFVRSKHRTIDGHKENIGLKIIKPYMDINYYYEENGELTSFSTTIAYDKVRHLGGLAGIWGKLYLPVGTKFYMEAGLNATLPSFTPMVLNIDIFEKKQNEFDIKVQGMWFTGVDASLVAVYQDFSVPTLNSRRLKAVITSSKFNEIAVGAKYLKSNNILNFDIEANQDLYKYGFIGHYKRFSDYNFSCYGQIDVKLQTYSLNLLADFFDDINLSADIHFDKVRDVHVTYSKINKAHIKKLNADLAWDVNRDPNKKLSIVLEILNKGRWSHSGSVALLYPGRLISGEFEILVEDWLCFWLIKLGWSPDDQIQWKLKMYSEMKNETVYAFLTEVDTPFEGWKNNNLNLIWRYMDNLQSVIGNVTWDKHKVSLNLLTNYMFKTNEIYGELNANINSSLPIFPTILITARHHHNWKKMADTLLMFEYNKVGLMMVNSSWKNEQTPLMHKVYGRMSIKTPYPGYRTGLLATKFTINDNKDVNGLTHFQLEENIYTITLDGHARRFTNCFLQINITSPDPLYSLMTARIGLIDTDRHIVAMIETPNITVGLEFIINLKSSKNFHIFGHIAIPVDFFHNVMVQAKRNSEEIDFRLGFENMTLGCMGIWHYKSKTDFQYLYKLFTPLQGLEENGLVLKNIYRNGLDSEFSIKLSKHKLGAAAMIKENGKGLLKMIEDQYKNNDVEFDMSNGLFNDFSTDIIMSLDTLFYDTISLKAALNKIDSESEEEIVRISGNIFFKNATLILLTNKLVLQNLLNFTNDFYILTQTNFLPEAKIFTSVDIIIGENYNVNTLLQINNGTEWTKNSIDILYIHETDENEKKYVAILKMDTQLDILRYVDAKLDIYTDYILTKLLARFDIPSCNIQFNGQIELDDAYIESVGSLNITSEYFHSRNITIEYKKDIVDVEITTKASIYVQSGNHNNYIKTEITNNINSTNYRKMKILCSLLPMLPPSIIYIALSRDPKALRDALRVDAEIGSRDMQYSITAERDKSFAKVSIVSPHRGFRKINFQGEIKNDMQVVGIYQGESLTYNIKGNISGHNPIEVTAILRPTKETEPFTFHSLYSTNQQGDFNITASLIGSMQFTLRSNLTKMNNSVEFFAELFSVNEYFDDIFVKSKLHRSNDNVVSFIFQSASPFKKFKMLDFNWNTQLSSKRGFLNYFYNTTIIQGDGDMTWSFHQDDFLIKALVKNIDTNMTQKVDFDLFYNTDIKSNGSPTKVGIYLNFDDSWRIGTNASLTNIGINYTEALLNILLPQPNEDVHTISLQLNAIPHAKEKTIELQYKTDVSQKFSRALGKLSLPTNIVNANIILESGKVYDKKLIDGKFWAEITDNTTWNVKCDLITPLYLNEETLKIKGTYEEMKNDIIALSGILFYPASEPISDFEINYGGWKYTVGKVNISTPLKNLPWLATSARLSNEEAFSENMVKIVWSNDTAIFNSTQKYTTQNGVVKQLGIIIAEIPLNSKHVLIGNYDYQKAKSWSLGNGTIFYNDKQFVKGNFNSKSHKTDDDLFHDILDADIENSINPIGIHYDHKYSQDGIKDVKQASLYELYNATNFNLTGKLDVEPWNSGKQIKLTVIQDERIIRFTNNFEMKEKDVYQGSKLELNPERWFQYSINIQNKSLDEEESHKVVFNMEYPKRFLGFHALYHLNESLLDGEAVVNWAFSDKNKTVKLSGEWDSSNIQELIEHNLKMALSHPSFQKDVTLSGKYLSDSLTMSNVSAIFEYSVYDNERLTFNSILKDNSNGAARDYKFYINCEHPATDLSLKLKSDLKLKYNNYYINNDYRYQKSLLYEKIRQGKLYLNLENHTAIVEQTRDENWYHMNGQWFPLYPNYKVFFTIDRNDGNDTGSWILSAKDKSIIGHFNRSDDASYHLVGKINDARSAELNAWRDFEDITTVDISSYIKLNHSKLLTSKVTWRPEMYQQIKNSFTYIITELHSQTDEILTLIKEIPMEANEALKNVMSDSKSRVNEFIADLKDIQILREDIEDFQIFMNESYNANEFYIKNIVEFMFRIMDETSIRNHFESLPTIVNEIWQIMGHTGSSLQESMMWVIETIKSSYAHFMEQVNDFLNKDLMDQVSDLIETGIMKYDNFVKKMHLEFLSFCETMWYNTINKMNLLWKNILNSLEPTYVHLAHYAESYLFQFGTEILDFFYARTEELTETPFFGLLAQFARDIDRFWKDLNNNDAITNFQKYSSIFINFFKTKILVHIPFQKELTEIYNDILYELNKLQELNIVVMVKEKFWEAKYRLQWWYDYFDVGNAVNVASATIYKKIMEIPKTALQLEDSHRKAKTNFVFDPNQGIILLEQKLPMPWHAFNRTPVFSEIPEYKFVHDLVNTWLFSNISLISYYYEFKLYTDIYNLFPPYKGHAVFTSQGTIVTFDREVFTIKDGGLFLLATDFWTRNFTILAKSNNLQQYSLLLLTHNHLITINIAEQSVSTSNKKYQSLPANIDNWIINRDEDTIRIESSEGVKITCNFIFNTCTFEVIGPYFSRLGGLMGNMNNEHFDDMRTPKGDLTTYENFIKSWKIDNADGKTNYNSQTSNATICESFFKNNVSPLKECFSMMSAVSFYDECLSGMDPCVLAKAYHELCFYNHIPTVIPSKCLECRTPIGMKIEQGTIGEVTESNNSTDIVFIVEVHECNRHIKNDKNIDNLINKLDAKLVERGFTENRYAVVGFGNQGIYKNPQSVYVRNKLFTSAREAISLFDHLHIGKTENTSNHADMFDALSKAANLNYRPGVSKIFVLIPCSRCDEGHFRLDYPVIHQVLTDSSITLHIIANDEFRYERRKRLQNIVYGIDSKNAYTTKDYKNFSGDASIRKFVKYPKSTLGFCAALVMETNGTLFMGNKMKTSKKDSLKVINVFASRVALNPTPFLQTRCECHAAKLRCTVRPRQLSPYAMEEFAFSSLENVEIDFIDNYNYLNTSLNTLWG